MKYYYHNVLAEGQKEQKGKGGGGGGGGGVADATIHAISHVGYHIIMITYLSITCAISKSFVQ